MVGTVGPIPAAHLQTLEAEGVPADAIVGVSGLELALDSSLRGSPGGELLAVNAQTGEALRVLASATPKAASAVRTTISPSVQRAAVTALGGQLGGIVAMVARHRADPGRRRDRPRRPAAAGLDVQDDHAHAASCRPAWPTRTAVFPYATYATLDGVKLSNANGEECGGSLELAFAVSCNSVFAPLGVKLGAARLVATAERYGFNHSPGVPGAVESTLPPASQIQGQLDVGSTAIGQGEVQASALEMATVAATIADGGRRPQPTFDPATRSALTAGTSVSSAAVAHTVRRLMIGVVR